MAPPYRDFVELIRSLEDADPTKGIVLINARFQESFHPYPELFRRVRALARQFRARGVRAGQRVVIPLATDMDTIASFLALVYLGAVPFSVTAPLIGQDREAHRRQMVRLVAAHNVDWLLVSDDLSGIAGAYPETPAEMGLVVRRPTPEELADPAPLDPAPVEPDDLVFVQFSSGSTAQPKGVQITHRGLIWNTSYIADADERTPDSVWVSWLPLYHDMGLIGGLLTNFLHKNTLVLMHTRSFMVRPIEWLAAITRFHGTVTAIPNFGLDLCFERISDEQLRQTPIDLGSMRFIYNGSEPVRVESIRRFEERFAPYGFVPGSVCPAYGMAEAVLMVTCRRPSEPEASRRIEGMDIPSVGVPAGDFQIRIEDEAHQVLGPEQVGEVLLRGTTITPGYLDEASNAELFRDGWLATGDLGMLDREGRLYITGRKKDLLIVQGRNFYGHDIACCIEDALRLKGGAAYVFAVDKGNREAVVAMVVPPKPVADDAVPVDAADLIREAQRCVLREYGLVIDDVLLVPKLPKTTSGKIIRHLCRQMYLDARA